MAEGNVFVRPLGPLPVWAWMGVGLGGALAVASWNKNKRAAQDQSASRAQAASGVLPSMQTASGSTSASLIPQFVNQVYNQETPPTVNITQQNTQTANSNNTVTPPASPPPGPPPPGPPPPPPPAPAGQWVTVGVWNSTRAPWNSTLWGIAQQIYGNGADYPKIFNANKVGVSRPDGTSGQISNPNLIYPNERIWVPA